MGRLKSLGLEFCSQSDPLEGAINKSRPWGIAPNTTHKVMEVSKVMGGTPKSSIYRWMLHEINHPASLGYPH